MTAKELIEKLSEVAPETEIIGGLWNGRVTWRMQRILSMHRSKEWKKEQIYKLLQDFDKNMWPQGDK